MWLTPLTWAPYKGSKTLNVIWYDYRRGKILYLASHIHQHLGHGQTRPCSSVGVGMKSQDTKNKDFKCQPEPICTTLLSSDIATRPVAWLTMFNLLLET